MKHLFPHQRIHGSSATNAETQLIIGNHKSKYQELLNTVNQLKDICNWLCNSKTRVIIGEYSIVHLSGEPTVNIKSATSAPINICIGVDYIEINRKHYMLSNPMSYSLDSLNDINEIIVRVTADICNEVEEINMPTMRGLGEHAIANTV